MFSVRTNRNGMFVALLIAVLSAQSFAQPQRERRVASDPTSPAQVATSTPAPISIAPRTLADLQSQIDQIVQQPALQSGFFAVKVVSLDTGKTIFEHDANKFVRPASNMKLYTVAAALDRLTPDYHFVTSVYAKEKPENGTLKGDLTVYGRGDPSLAARFNNGDYFKSINDLADRIVAAGIKRVKGDLVGDGSYFNGAPLGGGWEWEDLQWGYGAPVSALTINDNAVDLTIKPADRVGAPVVITTGPPSASFITLRNQATTGLRGSKRTLRIYRGLGANTLEVTGIVPMGDSGFSGDVAVPDPALAFVTMLREALVRRGVRVDGRVRTVDARSGAEAIANNSAVPAATPAAALPLVEIASLQSPPFSVIAAQTLKPSQNLYTEIILRTLAKQGSTTMAATALAAETDEDAGLQMVRDFLHQAGIADSDLYLNDGSGLSRNDMITANATVQLLSFMSKHKYASQFREALPIAGVDGTLRSRMRGTAAENNVRAKTGSLSSVASLSGYVTTAAGEHLVFSMMLNNYPDAAALRRDSIDAIAVLLASFPGKTQ
jgi:D-alanyl-D-alanine carboxypeptidase/D-alanyl-D-alanine-endopeptidase (penicillin-binding protein 4)